MDNETAQPTEDETFNALVSASDAALYKIGARFGKDQPLWHMKKDEDKLKPGAGLHVPMLFQNSNFGLLKDATLSEIRDRMNFLDQCLNILINFWRILDSKSSTIIKEDAFKEIQVPLEEESVYDWVMEKLTSNPLVNPDLEGALELCKGNEKIIELLKSLPR
tara:strand:+ start:2973 stop:3461 length:489 start_codon:yes stop_codon:yes gene_type:complete